ncbi:flagellar basal body-associated FliL family protein [Roseibaca sp. Y0-43]|uniref:flagellar basal body-associated FliL family protein n=1 Tax=Roseibaca sp. Y0-43 TaxID=2816854 RepID=UPI001D0C9693|nr:flagellar basal body-associated FliL family protein [Roseibaca sp. Y0-43]
MPILIGVAGAALLGGGGFYAVYSGMILGHKVPEAEHATAAHAAPMPSYMPIDQLTLSLANPDGAQHLRMSAQIEIADGRLAEAEGYRPRFLAVMNTYLRAIEPRDLQDSAALIRLRAQILRRLQMVAGEDLVDDFLITEFILN